MRPILTDMSSHDGISSVGPRLSQRARVRAPMRYSPAEQLVGLMLELGAAHAGLGVADIMERFGVSRRTAERMLAAVARLLPLEELDAREDRRKRWRIKRLPAVLSALAVDELAALQLAATGFDRD